MAFRALDESSDRVARKKGTTDDPAAVLSTIVLGCSFHLSMT